VDDFAEFFAATRNTAFRAVFAATGSRAAAEDALAEAYARGYANWSTLREHPRPTAWILRTALNVHRSVWRRLRREVLLAHPPEGSPSPQRPGGLDARVRSAIAALPRRQREGVALRLLADLSAEETAAVLGLATSTVHVHLHRALAALRGRLESRGGGARPVDRPGPTSRGPADPDPAEFMRMVRHAD
jgi:RNA polymerase sigma factor (sigma-70 family)